MWENDNAGGFESYMEAEEENGAQAAEVYRRPERKKQAGEGRRAKGPQ